MRKMESVKQTKLITRPLAQKSLLPRAPDSQPNSGGIAVETIFIRTHDSKHLERCAVGKGGHPDGIGDEVVQERQMGEARHFRKAGPRPLPAIIRVVEINMGDLSEGRVDKGQSLQWQSSEAWEQSELNIDRNIAKTKYFHEVGKFIFVEAEKADMANMNLQKRGPRFDQITDPVRRKVPP
ncbi:hypothetical protein C8R44DRAFT_738765 [Mycena epipterygia]|nr:hypothetical protein C8R44DRAFT_738765 [Mycena epipterygia]